MVRNLAVACLLVVTMVASTAWGQKELKCDQVVKNPVGFAGLGTQFDSKEDCEKALASKAAELYSKALDQASGFCKMWYTCPKEWPLYYAAGKTQEEACKCTNHEGPNRDKWSGSCSLIWNGVCGCQSPSDNPGLSHLDAPLTDLETAQIREWYPVASDFLTALLKRLPPENFSQVLAALARSIAEYKDGNVFTTAQSREGQNTVLEVFLAGDVATVVRGRVATIEVHQDGRSKISEAGGLPGGVKRGLFTAIANALEALR